MTPAARIEAAIELLAQVAAKQRPAEQVVSDYVRARRFMGSKDRRAVADLVFLVLRAQARLAWWESQSDARTQAPNPDSDGSESEPASPGGARAQVLLALVLAQGLKAERVAGLCDGSGYHPAPLEPHERRMLDAAEGNTLSDPRQSEAVRLEVPEWILPYFQQAFGEDTETELQALLEEAPLDLRVNPLVAEDRESVRAALAEAGVGAAPTPYSRLGLRVTGRRAVTNTALYREGHIEVQDEGSQLIAMLADARPGQAVCDFCAGAGGKTLALAGAMGDQGRLVALDVDGDRLGRAGPRLSRAGARNVERRLLTGEGDPWLDENAGAFDRVLVDAPCSGVGAWRRQPDSRWGTTEGALKLHQSRQAAILERACALVRPGGRLIYATCSLLPPENREQVERFLAAHPEFESLPIEEVWRDTVGPDPVASGPDLTLTPARHGTDGFYAAVLQRKGSDSSGKSDPPGNSDLRGGI